MPILDLETECCRYRFAFRDMRILDTYTYMRGRNFAQLAIKFDTPCQRCALSPATLNFNFDFFQRIDSLERIKQFIRRERRVALSTVKIMIAVTRQQKLIHSTFRLPFVRLGRTVMRFSTIFHVSSWSFKAYRAVHIFYGKFGIPRLSGGDRHL